MIDPSCLKDLTNTMTFWWLGVYGFWIILWEVEEIPFMQNQNQLFWKTCLFSLEPVPQYLLSAEK